MRWAKLFPAQAINAAKAMAAVFVVMFSMFTRFIQPKSIKM